MPSSTPIAERYLQRSSASFPSPSVLTSSRSPTSSSNPSSDSTHRTSVFIEDDPFAPLSINGTFREELSPPLEEEDDDRSWRRASGSLRPSMDAPNGAALAEPDPPPLSSSSPPSLSAVKTVPRQPFLRSLLRPRPKRCRASLSVSKDDISLPILAPDSIPPRMQPLVSRASLINLGDITLNLPPSPSTPRPPPSPSYPSGSNSLRAPSVASNRPSLAGVFEVRKRTNSSMERSKSLHPPATAGGIRRPLSAINLGRKAKSLSRASSFGGEMRDTRAVENRPGDRTSIISPSFNEDDPISALGLALTTDAPTRRIVPDNARQSIASFSTASESFLASSDRSTQYSATSGSFSRPEISPRARKLSAGEDGSDLGPPPSAPLPQLPTAVNHVRKRSSRSGSITSNASGRTIHPPPRPAPLPPGLSESPPHSNQPLVPPRSTKRSQTNPHAAFNLPRPEALPKQRPYYSYAPSFSAPALAPFQTTPALPLPPPPASSAAPRQPLASLYLVCGLPKDPASWTLATAGEGGAPEHSKDAVNRFWRPEVLGMQMGGAGGAKGKGKGGEEEMVRLGKEEVQKIQAKAMKLAFDRDVEIVSASSQPPATTSIFSFPIVTKLSTSATSPVVTTSPLSSLPSSSTHTRSLSSHSTSSILSPSHTQTYHCVSLLVWSHADGPRSAAIRASLAQGAAKARAEAARKAAEAAKAGRKLGERLERRMRGPLMGAAGGGVWSDTEGETEGIYTESEWKTATMHTTALSEPLPPQLSLWLPYNLLLISTLPLYNLLSDALKLSWARYHGDITSHTLSMQRILNTVANRPGERLTLPVSVGEKQNDTYFVATIPVDLDWTTGVASHHNFATWPIFQALHADNLLTIAELALAPLGRVLFTSRHSVLLGLATLTFRTILEARGWHGLAHSTVHARDLHLYLDDPGPWLISLPFASLPLALSDLAPEVVLVDLDSNVVTCSKPTPGAVTAGAVRDKARRRLEAAIGQVGRYGISVDLAEAFPGGRFRPFSVVEVGGEARDAERLKPSLEFNESLVLQTFDQILSEIPRTGLSRIFRSKRPRKVADLDKGALHVQTIVRKHANTLVDRRDVLEGKVNRAQQKLALLMQESSEWERSFATFKQFSDKLETESSTLKTRLEEERRKANRLSSQLLQQQTLEQQRQHTLEARLLEVERARIETLEELSSVDTVRKRLEDQRSTLSAEISTILQSADDEDSALYRAVWASVESASQRSDSPLVSRPGSSFSRPGTAQSWRSNSRIARRPSFLGEEEDGIVEEDEEGMEAIQEAEEELRAEAMKLAVQETFRTISTRLSLALDSAGRQVSGDHPVAFTSDSGSSSDSHRPPISINTFTSPPRQHPSKRESAPPAAGATHRPLSPDPGPFSHARSPSTPSVVALSRTFLPKQLSLTPPTHELSSPFVTVRPPRRVFSPVNGPKHDRHPSLSASSDGTVHSSGGTPTAATATSSPLAHPRSSGLVKQASSDSSVRLPPQPGAPSGRARSRSNEPATTTTSTTDYDSDAQSFVSVTESIGVQAFAALDGTSGARYSTEPEEEEEDAFELEELAYTAEQVRRLSVDQGGGRRGDEAAFKGDEEERAAQTPRASMHERSSSSFDAGSIGRSRGHGRQESWSIDAPPVELFTRSMKARRSGGGGVLAGVWT